MTFDFKFALQERLEKLNRLIKKYEAEYLGKAGFINKPKQITYERFLDTLRIQTLTGQNFKENADLHRLYLKEKEYYQANYKLESQTSELHACVVVPTYLNDVDYRYAWHLESIFQQEYSNFRLIIIDDASSDKTS